jgi:membrane protease YdiL (CAAX protease family)
MDRIFAWFENEAKFESRISSFMFIVIGKLLLLGLGLWLVSLFPSPHFAEGTGDSSAAIQEYGWFFTLGIFCVLGPFLEELLYRVIPLGFAAWLVSGLKLTQPGLAAAFMVAAILASSAWFGLSHGDWANLFIQGAAGVVYAIVYLKWSRMGAKIGRGWLATAGIHGTYNLIAIIGKQAFQLF